MNETMLIRLKTRPLNKIVKKHHCKGETGLKVKPDAMRNLVEMTNNDQHRQDGFHEHTGIPSTTLA
jgi:hypothetical protein